MKKVFLTAISIILLVFLVCCDGTVDEMLFQKEAQFIAFTATEGTVDIKMTSVSYGIVVPTVSLQYSYDGTTWSDFIVDDNSTKGTEVTVQATDGNKTVYIQAKELNNTFGSIIGNGFGANYFVTSGSGKVDLSGNIMALLDNTGKTKNLSEDNNCAFFYLFQSCANIENADSLILPATELSENCYTNMFYACTGLKTAPALPAKTLAKECYSAMFAYCMSLESAPALPATTLKEGCYFQMFDTCTSLETAPALPATTLAKDCYSEMFSSCMKLDTAPALTATTLADGCYNSMFKGCGLTSTPALPATTLACRCYNSMFEGCTSLTSIGVIGNGTDAVTLAQDTAGGEGCLEEMFYGCSSLKINNDGSTGTKFFICPSSIPTKALNGIFTGTIGDNAGAAPTAGKSYYWYTSDCM